MSNEHWYAVYQIFKARGFSYLLFLLAALVTWLLLESCGDIRYSVMGIEFIFMLLVHIAGFSQGIDWDNRDT